jgi:DNA-binding ferritin-like protein (Dps family)
MIKKLFSYFKYVRQEKRRYKEMEARAKALPEEYVFVYRKIEHYMWNHAGGDGMDMIPILADLLDMLEAGAADGKRVLQVTGTDVAGFCDELLRNTKTWTATWHEALNRDIMKRLGKGNRDSR